MDEGLSQAINADAGRMQTLLTTFRQVGMPLLQAVTEVPPADGAASATSNMAHIGSLIDSTVTLSRELAAQLGAGEDQLDAWVRWSLAGAASQVVAASFKATGRAMSPEEAAYLAGIAIELQSKFKAQIPAGNEHALLAEVAEKLIKNADQVTRALAPSGSTPEQWRLLCWNVLKAAGQIYTESHYAEADRLLYMNPDERAAYFAQHGNIVPMTQVWQAFNQRMAMLATLVTYLEVPPSAQLEAEGWPA